MKAWLGVALVGLVACDADEPERTPLVGVAGSATQSRTAPAVPIYGGTMAGNDDFMVVADPSRSVVAVWSGAGRMLGVAAIPDAQPFRVALQDSGFLVTLRATGEVAAFDFDANLLARTYVCAEPRGVDIAEGTAVVACASGELVQLDASTLEVERTQWLATDLRDVLFDGDTMWLSRFRAVEVLELDRDTWEVRHRTIPAMLAPEDALDQPHVAWRMRLNPEGGVMVLHQSASEKAIDLEVEAEEGELDAPKTSPYGGIVIAPEECVPEVDDDEEDDIPSEPGDGPIVTTRLTGVIPGGDESTSEPLPHVVLATDFVFSHGEVVIAGGRRGRDVTGVMQVSEVDGALCTKFIAFSSTGFVGSVAIGGAGLVGFARGAGDLIGTDLAKNWDPILGVQELHTETVELFHRNPHGGIACASCHPEGTQDGHTWSFVQLGDRRTQDLTGGVSARAPFHWDGDFEGADDLMLEVFSNRMLAPRTTQRETDDLFAWLDGIPSIQTTPTADASQIDLGAELFFSAETGCAACHFGPQASDFGMHAVTRDGPTKTPSLLGVASRAPFMHDGCAPTLEARFTDPACGGGDAHGTTSHLSAGEIDALVAYLTTL